jgi:hypothetical protein
MEKIIRYDSVRNEVVLYRVKGDRNILLTTKGRPTTSIGLILRMSCLVKRIFEGKVEFGIRREK